MSTGITTQGGTDRFDRIWTLYHSALRGKINVVKRTLAPIDLRGVVSAIAIYQHWTRCETLTPTLKHHFHRSARSFQMFRSSRSGGSYAPFNQPPVKPARFKPRTRLGTLRVAFQMIPVL